jgi:hypothetical protein
MNDFGYSYLQADDEFGCPDCGHCDCTCSSDPGLDLHVYQQGSLSPALRRHGPTNQIRRFAQHFINLGATILWCDLGRMVLETQVRERQDLPF